MRGQKSKYKIIGYECIFAYKTVTKMGDSNYSMFYTKENSNTSRTKIVLKQN
jgi:hypothetical protein